MIESLNESDLELLHKWKQNNLPHLRISWDEYFMSLAFEAAKRSCDAQTQVGAFLTNDSHEPISMGYNSFPSGMSDDELPNYRPDKYEWIIHAEKNAILNCAKMMGASTKNTILYVTGKPCKGCLIDILQAGIKEVIYSDTTKFAMLGGANQDSYEQFFRIYRYLSDYRVKFRVYNMASRENK